MSKSDTNGLKASTMPAIATDVVTAWSLRLFVLCPFVCPSVTFVQAAKAVGRNEMPFGTDTRVAEATLCQMWPLSPSVGKDRLTGRNPVSKFYS